MASPSPSPTTNLCRAPAPVAQRGESAGMAVLSETLSDLNDFGILGLLDVNPRPSILLDLERRDIQDTESLPVVFQNLAIRERRDLKDELFGLGRSITDWLFFRSWALDRSESAETQPCDYAGLKWSQVLVGSRWKAICADCEGQGSLKPGVLHPRLGTIEGRLQEQAVVPEVEIRDRMAGQTKFAAEVCLPLNEEEIVSPETVEEDNSALLIPPFPEDPAAFMALIEAFPWETTTLGPLRLWPAAITNKVQEIVRDSRPIVTFWGSDHTVIYNKAYSMIAGSRHPELLGKTCEEAYPEIAKNLLATMSKARDLKRASKMVEWRVFLRRRDGSLEETYYTWTMIPVLYEEACLGFVRYMFDTTRQRVSNRRFNVLNMLSEQLSKATDEASFWRSTVQGFEAITTDLVDFSFMVLYSALHASQIVEESGSYHQVFELQGCIGPAKSHPVAAKQLRLESSEGYLHARIQAALDTGANQFLKASDHIELRALFDGIHCQLFSDIVTEAVIIPVRLNRRQNIMGFCILGLNPRSPLNSDYVQFIQSVSQKLATALASSVFVEEETKRQAETVEFEKAMLAKQLEQQKQTADEYAHHLKSIADVVPVGVSLGRPDGTIVYANDIWYETTGFNRDDPFPPGKFMECVTENYLDVIDRQWQTVITSGETVTYELKLKTRATPQDDINNRVKTKWVLANCVAEKDSSGELKWITSCITDISAQKEAGRKAVERADNAEKLSQSLSRMQRMADSASVAMFDVDKNGAILQANDAFYWLMGIKKSADPTKQVTMAEWCAAIHDDDVSKAVENFGRIMKGEVIDNIIRIKDNPWVHDDGTGNMVSEQRYLLASAIPIKNLDGSDQTHLSCCLTDISAQKAQEQSIAERANLLSQVLASQERFSRFAAAAPIAMSIIDLNGVIIFSNDTWAAICQPDLYRTEEESTPYNWLKAVYEEDVPLVREVWSKMTSAKEPLTHTYSFRLKHPWEAPTPPGEPKITTPTWIQASSFPEFDTSGAKISIMNCMTEISDYKWAENIHRQRMVEALESKRQQENFIDMTSHEIRNPLSAIVQCADLVVSSLNILKAASTAPNNDIEAGLDAAGTIISCAQHQRRIVDDILTLSKLDSKLLTITPVQSSAIRVLKEAYKMFETEASRLNINLSMHVDPSINELGIDWLLMDPSRTTQVLINLLTNALKFTQNDSSRSVTISMSASSTKPSLTPGNINYVPKRHAEHESIGKIPVDKVVYLQFAVRDTGRGLTPAERDKLFKRFSQASPRTHVKYGGSGLGLFISRELTEMQGGEIGVASEAGAGSTFAFYISTQTAAIPAEKTNGTNVSIKPRTKDNKPRQPLSIMVVEDNLINQAVLKKQLKNLGCQVVVANHGGEALTHLKDTIFWRGKEKEGIGLDIVLMDIEMPVMDGLTCSRKIRALQKSGEIVRHIPMIAVSANARVEQMNTARAAGMDDVVVKPFRIPELMRTINAVLEDVEGDS